MLRHNLTSTPILRRGGEIGAPPARGHHRRDAEARLTKDSPPVRAASCAILFRDGRILLGKRSPHRRLYPNCWDAIGGHVEAGETVQQALMREVEEEIGLAPIRYREIDRIAAGLAVYHMFVVEEWRGGEPAMRGSEHTELRWFSIEEACRLEDLALPQYREIFRGIAAGGPFDSGPRR
jgi:8-oxo-dGTP diphosphatase